MTYITYLKNIARMKKAYGTPLINLIPVIPAHTGIQNDQRHGCRPTQASRTDQALKKQELSHRGQVMEEIHRIINAIYDAAVDPDRWPDALARIERMFNSIASGLYTIDTISGSMTRIHLRGVDRAYADAYIDYFSEHNPWIGIPSLQRLGVVRTDQTLDEYHQAPGFYRKCEYFNEWLMPQNFHHTLGVNLSINSNVITKFYMFRSRREGSFKRDETEQFQLLAGHLTNAVKIGYRLTHRNSQIGVAEHLIDQMRLGIIYLDDDQRILQTNRFAEKILGRRDGLYAKSSSVMARNKEDNKKLTTAIQQAAALHLQRSDEAPRLFSVHRSSGHRAFRVMAIPFPRTQNYFPIQRPAVALLINDPELEPTLAIDELRHRYRLTSSEARLAQQVASGFTLRDAASRSGITYESARTYLKIIFQKTGTRKQSELVRLLLSEGFLEPRRTDFNAGNHQAFEGDTVSQ